MVDATQDEAAAVLERIKADYEKHHGRPVRSVRRYISGFDAEDLTPHLAAIRAQRAPEDRAEPSASRVRTVCALHGMQGACPACRDELRGGGALARAVIDMYLGLGPDRERLRPDLAAHPVIAELTPAG